MVGDHLRFPAAYWRHGCVFNVKRPLVRDHLQNVTGDHHFMAKNFWMGDHFTFMCKPNFVFWRFYYAQLLFMVATDLQVHKIKCISLHRYRWCGHIFEITSGKISWMHDHSSVCVRPNLLLGDSIFFKDCHSRYNKAGEQIFWQVAYQLTAFIEICILYPEFLARLAKYLCQRLTVLQV